MSYQHPASVPQEDVHHINIHVHPSDTIMVDFYVLSQGCQIQVRRNNILITCYQFNVGSGIPILTTIFDRDDRAYRAD